MRSLAKPAISVIIPVYNRCAELIDTLNSLSQSVPMPLEVLIVNDGSTDDVVQKLTNYRSSSPLPIKLLNLPRNAGPAGARNEGIRNAAGDYLWFLDSDVELPAPTLLGDMLKIMEERSDIGAVGGSVETIAGQWIHSRTGWEENALPRIAQYPAKDLGPYEPDSLSTSNMLVDGKVARSVGLFNETLCFLEDLDYSLRIRKSGKKLFTDKNTCILHHHFSSGKADGGVYSFYSSLKRYTHNYHKARLLIATGTLGLPLSSVVWKDFVYCLKVLGSGGRKGLKVSGAAVKVVGEKKVSLVSIAYAHITSLFSAYLSYKPSPR
ncbi:MAG: glycosyltransferase family 2 protein [Candidatus Omnitrophota bacterium]